MTAEATAVRRIDSWMTPRMLALLLVALPVLVNAIALAPEVRYGAPSDNDQIFHYLFVERANQAVVAGDNPVDHWLPELELGFPQFHYYQNLPHLTVVALYHLMFERVSLLTTLNLVRYLLMVLFPLTVYWSMRRMEFSLVAAAVAAAFGSTLSSRVAYGFDFHSYIWGGLGMFPQLCSMHLMFIGIACLYRVLERNTGFVAAIVAASAMVLSDLLYGYIFALAALILWLWCVVKQAFTANGAADALEGSGALLQKWRSSLLPRSSSPRIRACRSSCRSGTSTASILTFARICAASRDRFGADSESVRRQQLR